MTKEVNIIFSDKESEALQQAAAVLGVDQDEAASILAKQGIANRMRSRMRRKPSPSVSKLIRR